MVWSVGGNWGGSFVKTFGTARLTSHIFTAAENVGRAMNREALHNWIQASRPPFFVATLIPLAAGWILADETRRRASLANAVRADWSLHGSSGNESGE